MWEDFWAWLTGAIQWLGISPTSQDAIKALLLVLFALATLMILGDIYRGEIQNTFHRIRLIANPTIRDKDYRSAFVVPKYVVGSMLDGVYSNILVHYRYRDHRGRLRTKFLVSYRAKFKVRTAFRKQVAEDQEQIFHRYSEDEKIPLAKELPDLETNRRPMSEVVAMAQSRVDYINAQWDARMSRADDRYSKLSRSRLRRFLAGLKEDELVEPEKVGLVVKFHFPINPYFLLYKHPEANVRSTAWLTVLTSLFAIFMQIVYTQRGPVVPSNDPAAVIQASHTDDASQARMPLRAK